MSDSSTLKAKIAILNNLNSIINANKKRYESLKFNLITDRRNYSKQKRQNNNLIILNENEFELKLPCWIVHEAFQDHCSNKNKYRFIRKLITMNKNYFINSFEDINRKETPHDDIETFASNIIHDILNKSIQISIHNKPSIVNSFAENFVDDLFKELQINQSNSTKMIDLPDLVIDKASRSNSTEGEDTLDDMSSLNSSMGSHCRQLFVHNFLVQRRHSADVVGIRPIIHKNWKNLRDFGSECSIKKVKEDHQTLHLPINITRRHSLNSFNLSNKEIIDLELINSPKSEFVQTSSQLKKSESIRNKVKILMKKRDFKRSKTIKKYLKELLNNLRTTRKFSLILNEDRRSKSPKISPNQLFASNLFDEIWNESINVIKSMTE